MSKSIPIRWSEESQPALFSVDVSEQAVAQAAKVFIHTGKIVTKDEARAAAIVEAYCECGSLLAVSRRFQCSPNTVKAVLAVMEEAGKLDGVKERVSRKLGTIAELGADSLIEDFAAGRVPVTLKPIALGVAIERKADLDGDPNVRIEVTTRQEVTLELVTGYLKKKGIDMPVIDVESNILSKNSTELPAIPIVSVTDGGTDFSRELAVQADPMPADRGHSSAGQGGGDFGPATDNSSIDSAAKILTTKDE